MYVPPLSPLIVRSNVFTQDEGKFDPKVIPLKSWSDYVRSTLVNVLFQC